MTRFKNQNLVTGPHPVDAALAFAKQQWPDHETTATEIRHGASDKFYVKIVRSLDDCTNDVEAVVQPIGDYYVVTEWSELPR